MLRAFSLVYWAFVIVTLPIFFAVALAIFLVTLPLDRRRVALHLYSCFWASFYLYANPLWRVRVEGRERLPWKGPAVLVANHASIIDILVLYRLYRPFKWVSKASNFRLPFVGWNMRINGYVSVSRGERRSIEQMMVRCRELLSLGAPVLIFPEGTRSLDRRLLPFKMGAFQLAMAARCPIIPIAVTGTGDSLPKSGIVLRQRMDARVRVLAPLDPAAYPTPEALRDATRELLASAVGAPSPGAGAADPTDAGAADVTASGTRRSSSPGA